MWTIRRVTALGVLCVLGSAAPVRAQAFVTLQPAQTSGITNTTTTRAATTWPQSFSSMELLVNITAGGTATGTLQMFVEDSCDGGTTWDDLVVSNTFAFGAAVITQRFWVNGLLIPSSITTLTSTNLTQGSAAAAETAVGPYARQGPWCPQLRVREKVSAVAGSPAGPTYTITASPR